MEAAAARTDSTKESATRFSVESVSATGRQSCCSLQGPNPTDASYDVGVDADVADVSA